MAGSTDRGRPAPLARTLRRFAAGLIIAASAFAAHADPRYAALLVGVSEYPAFPASMQLAGPRNDVLALRDRLVERGISRSRIRILADGVEGAALPTREAILAALDQLAADTGSGDTVVVYFAGHGSREPASPDSVPIDSPDGLDEVLLPRDAGWWQQAPAAATGSIPHAILAREIRDRVERIEDAGAFVWAIFDACHSAGIVRGTVQGDPSGTTEVRVRGIAPEMLGVPAEALARAARTRSGDAGPSMPRVPARSRAVYFYAAQPLESTLELSLPSHHRDSRRHGLFTYTLLQSLSATASISYRQLAQSVLIRYASIDESASTTPIFAGAALDDAVLGRPGSAVRQWQLAAASALDGGDGLAVTAGELDGLEPGAILAVLPGATAADADLIGYVRVTAASANRARLQAVAYRDRGVATETALRSGAIARFVALAPSAASTLTVAADLGACSAPCRFAAALDELRRRGPEPGRNESERETSIAWVDQVDASQLVLVAVGDRLWLLPATTAGRPCAAGSEADRRACVQRLSRHAPSIVAAGDDGPRAADAILAALQSAARTSRLMRIASAMALEPEGPIRTEITLDTRASGRESYREGTVPDVAPRDHVRAVVRNSGAVAADVTVLYVDGRQGVEVVFPSAGAVNRLDPGAEIRLDLQLNASQTDGVEHLVVLAVPAQLHRERADYSMLQQAALPAGEPVRGESGHGEAGRGEASLGAGASRTAPATPRPITVRVASWRLKDRIAGAGD